MTIDRLIKKLTWLVESGNLKGDELLIISNKDTCGYIEDVAMPKVIPEKAMMNQRFVLCFCDKKYIELNDSYKSLNRFLATHPKDGEYLD